MIAYLYPGQGAQQVGMLGALPDAAPVAATLDAVSSLLDHDVRGLDTTDALFGTVGAQLALFTVGVAVSRLLADNDIGPDAVAGHSIGAFAAAVTAGVLTLEEALNVVRVRAVAMEDLFPSGYGLLAMLGARLSDARRLAADLGMPGELFVAMENAEDQIVLAGSDAAFERVHESAPRYGARELRRLDVTVPSHCPLMAPVAGVVQAELRAVPTRRPTVRYLAGLTARSAATGSAVKNDLAKGVARMVRWRDTTELLAELGTSLVIQISPGHTTAALFAAAHPDIPVVALADASWPDSLARIQRTQRRT